MTHKLILQILAVAAVIIGLVIRYIINRRKFYRRGVGGLQHFRSYERAVIIRFFEGLFSIVSGLLILAGGLALVLSLFVKT